MSGPRKPGAEKEELARHFAVIMEEPSMETEEGNVFATTFYNLLVFCHERTVCKGRPSVACKEYMWRIRRRFSDFEELGKELRDANLLPAGVAAPKKTYFQHLVPSKTFAQQRAAELLSFLNAVVDFTVDAAVAQKAAAQSPTSFEHLPGTKPQSLDLDMRDLCSYVAEFLGLEKLQLPPVGKAALVSSDTSERSSWALPENAEERTVALVHSLDRGVYIWGHLDQGPPSCRFRRYDKQASFGDINAVFAEGRSAPLAGSGQRGRAATDISGRRFAAGLSDIQTPPFRRAITPTMSQLQSCGSPSPMRSRLNSEPASISSTPTASVFPSPTASPSQSRCPSPLRSVSGGSVTMSVVSDECPSFGSASTADTDVTTRQQEREPPVAGVWLEVELNSETCRLQEHSRWWNETQRAAAASKDEGASPTDVAKNGAARTRCQEKTVPDKVDRSRLTAHLEQAAALYREVSLMHEDLHPILGYGGDDRSFVVVQQAVPANFHGLRTLPFTPYRCHRVLGQALKALLHLHDHGLAHGHLSPESFLVQEGKMGPQVRLAWTPGQRRPEGHISATLGFRGPGQAPSGLPGDIYALACVILVWWAGFAPVAHPWTQFTRSHRLQQDIQTALAEQPPQLPKALLDLHGAAAVAEEPEHTFLSLLASLLTRCLVWQQSERPGASALLHDRFFGQAL